MFGTKLLPILLLLSSSLSGTAASPFGSRDKIPEVLYRSDHLNPTEIEAEGGLNSRGSRWGRPDTTMTFLEHKQLPKGQGKYPVSPFISTSADRNYLVNYLISKSRRAPGIRYVYHINTKGIERNFFDANKKLSGKADPETLSRFANQKEFGTTKQIPWGNIEGWDTVFGDGSVYYISKVAWLSDMATRGKQVSPSLPKRPMFNDAYYVGPPAKTLPYPPQ